MLSQSAVELPTRRTRPSDLAWVGLLALMFIYLSGLMRTFLPQSLALSLRWPALAAALAVLATRRTTTFPDRWERFVRGTALAFFAAAGLSMFFSKYPELVAMKLVAQVMTTALAMVAARRLTPDEWQKFIVGLQWMFGVAAAAALVLGHQGASARLGGLSNPNSLGAVGTAAASLILWDLLDGNRRRHKRLYWWSQLAMLMASLALIVATGSRSSQAGFAMALGICVLSAPKRQRLIEIAAVIAIPATFLMSSWFVSSLTLAQNRWARDDLLESRRVPWEGSLAAWERSPWFGHGFGVSDTGVPWTGGLSAVGIIRDGTGYLGMLESVGIVGFLPLVVLLSAAGTRLLYVAGLRRSADQTWVTAMKAGTLLMALAVQHVGEPWLMGPGMMLNPLFWLSLGAFIGCSQALTRSAAYFPQQAVLIPGGQP